MIDKNTILRRRADRADAVIGWAGSIGLLFLVLAQIVEKLA